MAWYEMRGASKNNNQVGGRNTKKHKTRRKGGFMGLFKKKVDTKKRNNKNYNNMNLTALEAEHKRHLNKFNKIHEAKSYMIDLSKKSAFNNNRKTAEISSQWNRSLNKVGNDLKKVQKAIAKKKGYAGGRRKTRRKRRRKKETNFFELFKKKNLLVAP